MSKRIQFLLLAATIAFGLLFFFFQKDHDKNPTLTSPTSLEETTSEKTKLVKHDDTTQPSNLTTETNSSNAATADFKNKDALKKETLYLTYGNFESFVTRCFNGEPCKLQEDPVTMYKAYKDARNLKACGSLLSFMRSQLKYEDFKNQYKDSLFTMIHDFYPAEEIQFQDAAYYNYLGDYKKSLELYLDLEKKHQTNPALRKAPNLNIANTYYSLNLMREALRYYELALDDFLSDVDKVQQQREIIGFTQKRIVEIKKKLNIT